MALSDAQHAARLASMEDLGDVDDGFSIDSSEHEDDPTEAVAWDFQDLQDSVHRGTPALQAIQDLCTKYNVKQSSSFVDAQAIIEDGILSIPRVVELTDNCTEVTEKCLTHTMEHEIEVACLNGLAFQRMVLQRKSADTLRNASDAVVSYASSLKKARDEVSEASKERIEYKLKWEQGDGAEKGWFTSAKNRIPETRGLLAQARDTILQKTEDHKEQLTIEKRRSGSFKEQPIDLTGQVAKVEELLRTSCSRERTALAENRTLDAQQRNVLGHLRTLRSKMPGFQTRVAEVFEDGFSAFFLRLAASLSDLAAAQRRGTGGALNETADPLSEVLTAFEEDLARSTLNISDNSSSNQ